MVEFHRSNDRVASRESASGFANVVGARLANDAMSERENDAMRSAQQVALMDNVSPLASMNAEQLDAHIESMANRLSRDRVAMLESRVERLELGLARAHGELVDLRAAQQPADPTGAHPYRSTAARAPSRPVATSGASERVEGRPGALRRVYGALASRWPVVALMTFGVAVFACGALGSVPALVGFGALLFSPGAAAFACSLFTGETCA